MSTTTEQVQLLLVFPRVSSLGKIGYFVYHPERRQILPKFTELRWKRLENLCRYSVVHYKEFLFIIGGYCTKKKKYLRQALRYNLRTAEWYYCNKMKIARADFQAFVFDGKIYCAGGRTTNNNLTDHIESYELLTNLWFEEEPLPSPCAEYASVALESHGIALIVGGVIRSLNGDMRCSNHLWRFSMQKSKNIYLDEEYLWGNILSACFPTSQGVRGHRLLYDKGRDRVYLLGGTPIVDTKYPQSAAKVTTDLYGLYYFEMQQFNFLVKDIQGQARRQSVVEPEENSDIDVTALETVMSNKTIWIRRDSPGCKRSYSAGAMILHKIFLLGGETAPSPHMGTTSDNEQSVQSSSANLQEVGETPVEDPTVPAPVGAGYYDTKRKIWRDLFPMDNMDKSFSDVSCVTVTLAKSNKDLKHDRLDWLLQWSLW